MMLHCASSGSGPDIVLIHGWGWHGGVWASVARQLAARFRVWVPDLPGHGASREPIPAGIDGWMNAIKECVPPSAIWVGWSLGGLLALRAAHSRVALGVVLVGATPRFVQGDDWPCAWLSEEFERFSADLERDVSGTLERFASLHVGVGSGSRSLLRELRAQRSLRDLPEREVLKAGLSMLRDTDCRALLATLDMPALVVHGEHDRIVSAEAGERMTRALPRARYVKIDAAGHALPLSHADELAVLIGEFAVG
jgi:pimeloyl-[acyl-carrier protein] methyl ester esterase